MRAGYRSQLTGLQVRRRAPNPGDDFPVGIRSQALRPLSLRAFRQAIRSGRVPCTGPGSRNECKVVPFRGAATAQASRESQGRAARVRWSGSIDRLQNASSASLPSSIERHRNAGARSVHPNELVLPFGQSSCGGGGRLALSACAKWLRSRRSSRPVRWRRHRMRTVAQTPYSG